MATDTTDNRARFAVRIVAVLFAVAIGAILYLYITPSATTHHPAPHVHHSAPSSHHRPKPGPTSVAPVTHTTVVVRPTPHPTVTKTKTVRVLHSATPRHHKPAPTPSPTPTCINLLGLCLPKL